jgi:hypothetical protein
MEYIRWQMQAEQTAAACPLLRPPVNPGNLQWTGAQVELVELSYALCDAKSINNGEISLKELFAALGEFFNIRIVVVR